MIRLIVRLAVLTLCLAALAAGPAAAEIIKKGVDYWVTRPGGLTQFTFPPGDVEALCKLPADSNWKHQVELRGFPAPGADWDSAVARLHHAKFKGDTAHTKVQFAALSMVSVAPSDTPCGDLDWQVRLAKGKQPITQMRITKTNDREGKFFAELALRVVMQANDTNTGAYVGSLFYDIKLPDQPNGTDWSYGNDRTFRAGMDEDNSCLPVLREKLGTFPVGSDHHYFISDLIAKGLCNREGSIQ